MKTKKRIILLVISLLILTSSLAYGDTVSENTGQVENIINPLATSKYLSSYKIDKIQTYTGLTGQAYSQVEGLSELKDEIKVNFNNYESEFNISYSGDTGNLKEDIRAIINQLKKEDEYFSGIYSQIEYRYKYTSNQAEISFFVKYYTNKAQEEFVDLEVKRVVEDIIKDQMNDFQRIKSINDWIVLNTEYSIDTNTSPHAAYTLFKEGKGVCQAYALASYRLLEEAGLQVRYVTGEAGNIGEDKVSHAWNQVKVDGKWYNLDTTWNDPSPDKPGQVSYAYFLISDSTIGIDHFKDESRVYELADNNDYEYMREMSHAATLGDYIYYSSKDNDNKLYKNKIGTEEKTKLVDDRGQYIVGYGDYIYYSNYSDNKYIYKIKTNGKEKEALNNLPSKDLYMEYPYILYYDEINFKKHRIKIGHSVTVEGVFLNKSNISLTVGGQAVELEARVEPIDAINKDLIWESSNPSVARVEDGVITGIKAGNTDIRVRTKDGDFTDRVNVSVVDGYKIFPLNEEKNNPKYMWKVRLNRPVKADSVNFDSLYIENEYGEKLNRSNFNIEISKENPALININVSSGDGYLKDKLYYLVVDKSLKSLENKNLLNPVKMPFIIR